MLDLDVLVSFLWPSLISVDGNKAGYWKLKTAVFKDRRQEDNNKKTLKDKYCLVVNWTHLTVIFYQPVV